MFHQCRPARVSIKVLIIGLLLVITLGGSLFIREAWRVRLVKQTYAAGQTAYEAQDWSTAHKCFQEYLCQYPDNIEVLKKCAQARLRMRPFEPMAIYQAAAAYLRVIQLEPLDEVAYDALARLYREVRNFEDLGQLARKRLEHFPEDKQAPLWLAEALVHQEKTQAAQKVLEPYIAQVGALPEERNTFVRAYLLMSQIAGHNETPEAKLRALDWLQRAVDYAPASVDALAQRAQFYIDNPSLPGMEKTQAWDRARQDLEAVDTLGTDKPRLRLSLGALWMALGKFGRAQIELRAVDAFGEASLEAHYVDMTDFYIQRHFFATELALRMGVPDEAARIADETLDKLQRPGYRMRVLPTTIKTYIAADRVKDARERLNEYAAALDAHKGTRLLGKTLAEVQAQVAQAEARL